MKVKFLSLSVLLTCFISVNCKEYYITSRCPDPTQTSCLTLSQLAENASCCLDTDVVFLLQHGSHILKSELAIKNATTVSINGSGPPFSVSVDCEDNGRFSFDSIGEVSISNLHFNRCKGSQVRLVDHFMLEDCVLEDHNETVVNFTNSTATIFSSSFMSNAGSFHAIRNSRVGAAMIVTASNITIKNCSFEGNHAHIGGVMFAELHSNITISECFFAHNEATEAGAIFSQSSSMIIIASTFRNNTATESGAVLLLNDMSVITTNNILLEYNKGNQGIVYLVESTGTFTGTTEVLSNIGSLSMYYSNVTFSGNSSFLMNMVNASTHFHEGGAITVIRSHVYFEGLSNLMHNKAENGGTIHAIASKVYMYGYTVISNNSASDSGGGIYLFLCDLNCEKNCVLNIIGNTAVKGGGIYAVTSLLTAVHGSEINFIENVATINGGGIHLEVSAKINILIIHEHATLTPDHHQHSTLTFTRNSAGHKGGAIYVEDGTYYGTCNATGILSTASECFLQAIILGYELEFDMPGDRVLDTVKFLDNYAAKFQGSNLYGGLLDRCTLSPFTDRYRRRPRQLGAMEAIPYFTNLSNIGELDSIGSGPVRVCFCTNDHFDCSYQPPPISVMKGESFTVSLVTIDQAGHIIPAEVETFLLPSDGNNIIHVSENTSTGNNCTPLNFSVHSSKDHIELILYARGPCKDANFSQGRIVIQFSNCTCPIGFQQKITTETRCECECDEKLTRYVEIAKCIHQSKTLVRSTNSWINATITNGGGFSGYLVHRHCPLNYCADSLSVPINLTLANGADAQCALNRVGVLCGTCKSDFSVSLGSSNCIACPSYWPAVFIGIVLLFFLAGVVLVALVFVLNITVAVGTLNGIVFYANVMDANGGTFFTFSRPNYVTVFISWLNLDFGFDICIIKNLDTYWKTWLQLAFPIYIIFLVAMVIVISERSKWFSRLIGRKNPIAALATLIFLSYTKLLKIVITGLSCTTLTYSGLNGEHYQTPHVWLADATVPCYRGKHIVLFIVAVFILLAGLAYTLLLLTWQWVLYLRNKIIRSRAQVWSLKLSIFIETYHSPYTPQNRYWTGLLLLVRVILYIASTANVSSDPSIDLLTTGIVTIGILLFKEIISVRNRVYKKWPLEIVEVSCYLNVVLFSFATLFALENDEIRAYIAYTSVFITSVILVGILVYHIITEIISKTKPYKAIMKHTAAFCCSRKTSEEDRDNIELTEAHYRTRSMVQNQNCSSVKLIQDESGDFKSSYCNQSATY